MEEKIKDFLKNKEKILELDRTSEIDPISEWKNIRNPFKTPSNFLIIQIAKWIPFMKIKLNLLRSIGIKIGKNVGIAPSSFDSVFPELISIGNNSVIGNKVHIMTHEFTKDKIRLGKVNISNNVLIGAFSIIRSGVNIGENSVVSMCSFVNKDIPANEMWAGSPAKKIRSLK